MSRKITQNTAITGDLIDPANDVIPIVDVSDTTDGASGTTKKTTVSDFTTAIGPWLLASGGTLTGPNTIVGSGTNIIKWQFPSLATTPVNGAGLWLQNNTAAALGAQQISPSVVWEGQGWQTNTSGSQSVKFKADVLPVQGSTNPTGQWLLQVSINGAAYSNALVINVSSAGSSSATISGTMTADIFVNTRGQFAYSGNDIFIDNKTSGGAMVFRVNNLVEAFRITSGGVLTFVDAKDIAFGTTTGTKHGTATTQKQSFWNATPIVQPTTGVATATRVGGGGTAVTDTDTFGGYKIGQVVQALQNIGLLA